MFSTSTMASSTSSPIATAIPPRVITLIDSSVPVITPMSLNVRTVIASDSGMALREMNVVRTFIRNRNSTISTRTAPTTSASPTLYTPRSMNSRSSYRLVSNTTSAGSDGSTSANAPLTRSVRSRVSVCGCLVTVMATPGCPLMLASPRFTCAPSATRATSLSNTARSGGLPGSGFGGGLTTISFKSASTRSGRGPSRPITRIGFSSPPSSANPPVKFTLFARSAASTSWSVTLYFWSAGGSTSTWYCLRPPPIMITCATPDTFSRRGRTTQSARVRSASARLASDGNTKSRDCPPTVARTRRSPSGVGSSHRAPATATGSHAAGLFRSVTFQANRSGGPSGFGTRSA